MAKFGKAAEFGVFKPALAFFPRDAKIVARPAPPGSLNLAHSGEAAGSRLHAIYGDRLRVSGTGPAAQQHLRDLGCLPDRLHQKLAEYFSAHPEGGIDITDGPVTDVLPSLR